MTQGAAVPRGGMAAGIIADGLVKLALGTVVTAGAGRLGAALGVPVRSTVAGGVALVLAGGLELGHLRRRPLRTYLRLMTGFDSGLALASLAAVVVARQGGAGGSVWVGYLTVASLGFAAVLAAPRQTVSSSVDPSPSSSRVDRTSPA
ncbi:hypothetical protein [Pseudonocardia ammonioxydans]|nr:hypothetical protein [Pseudonocardia ammonioxydans]